MYVSIFSWRRRKDTDKWVIEKRENWRILIRRGIGSVWSEDITGTDRLWGVQTLLSLLFLIELVDFGDKFFQEKLYPPESLPYLISVGRIMLLRILLTEAGGASLHFCQ